MAAEADRERYRREMADPQQHDNSYVDGWEKAEVPPLTPAELEDLERHHQELARAHRKKSAPQPRPLGEAPAELLELNEQMFVIEEGGKHFVACEWTDPSRHRRAIKRYTFEEFKKRLMGQTVGVPGSSKRAPLAKTWLEWTGRRQYLGGVTFDPTDTAAEDVYNLWRGWPVAPRRGDWSIIREHIHDVICDRDDALDAYFVGWLARMVRHPEQPGGVVPVLRGAPGAGKTVIGDAVRRMFGQHAMAVSSPRAVTGQFNAHLRDLVFLLANEAFFAGDRASVSTLKALITDETLFIEQKGIDAVEVPNFLHILMTTNAEWAVPVAIGDRRFVVYDVSPRRVGDREYFRELHAAVADDAVISAMLHDLLYMPPGGFEVRDIPATRARHEQIVQSLEGADAWLLHVLTVGSLGVGLSEWQTWASTKTLQESHEAWARADRFRHAVPSAILGKFLRRFFHASRPRNGGSRPPGYQLWGLDEARARYCKATGLPLDVFDGEDGQGAQGDGQGAE